jgi:hypothetical protein
MNKKKIIILFICALAALLAGTAKASSLASRLKGRILLQV